MIHQLLIKGFQTADLYIGLHFELPATCITNGTTNFFNAVTTLLFGKDAI
jgi:hypothetical protein